MPAIVWIFIAVIAAVVIYNVWLTPEAMMARKIRKTRPQRIANINDGDKVTVTGEVVYAGRTVTAPLSGRSCVYYHVIVRRNNNSDSTRILIDEEKAGDLVLKSDGHYVLVSTQYAKALVEKDKKYHSGFGADAAKALEKFLQSHGESSETMLGFNKDLDYEEGVLQESETITVVGTAKWIENPSKHLRIGNERLLMIVRDKNDRVMITDDPDLVDKRRMDF